MTHTHNLFVVVDICNLYHFVESVVGVCKQRLFFVEVILALFHSTKWQKMHILRKGHPAEYVDVSTLFYIT